MFKLFSAFRKDKVWDFNGGIHPPEMKTQSNGTPLRQVSLPQRFVIPLKQHIGAEGELCVQPGANPRLGQNAAGARANVRHRGGDCPPLDRPPFRAGGNERHY